MAAYLQLKRGDTWRLRLEYVDLFDKPVDLAGCTAWMQVRDRRGRCVIDSRSAEVRVDRYSVEIHIDPALTQSVTPGAHRADAQLTYPDGTVQSTETIYLRVVEDVTRDD